MSPMVVTNEKGKQVGVLVPLKDYEKMMKALEDAADERAYNKAMRPLDLYSYFIYRYYYYYYCFLFCYFFLL